MMLQAAFMMLKKKSTLKNENRIWTDTMNNNNNSLSMQLRCLITKGIRVFIEFAPLFAHKMQIRLSVII